MKPNPVVVVAGSRALPPGAAPRLLVRFLANLPPMATVMLRRGLFSPPNLFESQVASLCDLLGVTVQWRQPDIPITAPPIFDESIISPVITVDESPARGREMTFRRDLELVQKADLVLCFVTHGQIGDELSGTSALIAKALEEDRVVYAYAVDGERVERIGEHDPTHEWVDAVPTPA